MKPTRPPFLTRTLTCVLIAAGLLHASLTSHAESISPEEAHAIGVEAYLYFYPLVTMDITRKQLTNVERAEGISAPMNTFANIPAYPTADMKAVVRPNFDTLYSSGWLDLTKEPVVASVPDTGGRYYLFPDARYVDGRVRVPGLANNWNAGRQLSRHAARLDGLGARRHAANQGTYALRMDHRPHQDRRSAGLRRRS